MQQQKRLYTLARECRRSACLMQSHTKMEKIELYLCHFKFICSVQCSVLFLQFLYEQQSPLCIPIIFSFASFDLFMEIDFHIPFRGTRLTHFNPIVILFILV